MMLLLCLWWYFDSEFLLVLCVKLFFFVLRFSEWIVFVDSELKFIVEMLKIEMLYGCV